MVYLSSSWLVLNLLRLVIVLVWWLGCACDSFSRTKKGKCGDLDVMLITYYFHSLFVLYCMICNLFSSSLSLICSLSLSREEMVNIDHYQHGFGQMEISLKSLSWWRLRKWSMRIKMKEFAFERLNDCLRNILIRNSGFKRVRDPRNPLLLTYRVSWHY